MIKRHLCARHCSKHWGCCSKQNRLSFCPQGFRRQIKTNKYVVDEVMGKCYGEKDLAKKSNWEQHSKQHVLYTTEILHVFKSAIILPRPLIYLHLNLNYNFKNTTPRIILKCIVVERHNRTLLTSGTTNYNNFTFLRLKLIELRVFFFDSSVLVGFWMHPKKILLVLAHFKLCHEIRIYKT